VGKILVTGASGHLGRQTLQHLLNRRPANDLVGLARDPKQAVDLAAQGIEIRKGDYFDYGSLLNLGEWGELTGDLERLIGHKPITTAEFLRDNYPMVVPQIEAAKGANKAG